jgi:hypothetical protein
MKSRVLAVSLIIALATTAFVGCGKKAEPTPAPAAQKPATQAPATPATDKKVDVVTTASVVDNNAAFEKALTKDGGKYCIAILKDLTFTKDLVVEGDYKTGKKDDKGNETIQRKVALYTQDDKKVVTARFTLTAPKITFNSNFGSLEHGTFKGDVYVAGKNFKLVNQKIDGNLYFLNEEAQKTFTIADKDGNPKSVVTGKQELKK